jgi:hypothetical protein
MRSVWPAWIVIGFALAAQAQDAGSIGSKEITTIDAIAEVESNNDPMRRA